MLKLRGLCVLQILTAAAYAQTSSLRFEPNVGQAGPEVRYIARGGGYTMLLTSGEAAIGLGNVSLRMKLSSASKESPARTEGKLASVTNYYLWARRMSLGSPTVAFPHSTRCSQLTEVAAMRSLPSSVRRALWFTPLIWGRK